MDPYSDVPHDDVPEGDLPEGDVPKSAGQGWKPTADAPPVGRPSPEPSPRRPHPWAGITNQQRKRWEQHRAAKRDARPAAQERAREALEAFLVSDGDGPVALAQVADDSEACLELVLLTERWERSLAGFKRRALHAFSAARHSEPDPAHVAGGSGRDPSEYLSEELGLALALAPGGAAHLIDNAVSLTSRLPATLAALETGLIDVPRVNAALHATAALSEQDARAVEDQVLGRGARPSRAAFTHALRRAADRADPDAAAERANRHRADPHVRTANGHDGVEDLVATLPAENVRAAWQRLTSLARRARRHGEDRRPIDHVRADVLSALLLHGRLPDAQLNQLGLQGTHLSTPPVEVHVLVAASTLAGLDDLPAHLEGHGTIPAELARRLAEHALLRRVVFDPVEGTVLDVGRRRYPTAGLAHHVQFRDGECYYPGCSRPAADCDLDHTDSHAGNGATRDGNLAPACRRHHRMKDEDNGFDVKQPRPGTFTVTTPTGRTYQHRPERPWTQQP